MKYLYSALLATVIAGPALADSHSMGDAEAGEKQFGKCKACHMIVDDAGESFQRGGKVGPNLFGIIGKQAGTVEDYRYGDDLVAAGEAGLVWGEANMAEYLVNPTDFLRTTLDDKKARSKMSFRMRKGGEDVAAYLATFSPEAEAEAEADAPMAKDAETEKTE